MAAEQAHSDAGAGRRGREGGFAETHWSLVATAGQLSSDERSMAVDSLCRTYRAPIYSFIRRSGYGPEDAEDLTQEFFLRLVDRNCFATADPQRGRFRSLLLGILKNVLSEDFKKRSAQKRGAGTEKVELEAGYLEIRDPAMTPEEAYDRRWAATILELALKRLRAEQRTEGNAQRFEILKEYLPHGTGADGYAEAAGTLAITDGAVGTLVHRLRRRYRALVRSAVADTVAAEDVGDEMNHLFG